MNDASGPCDAGDGVGRHPVHRDLRGGHRAHHRDRRRVRHQGADHQDDRWVHHHEVGLRSEADHRSEHQDDRREHRREHRQGAAPVPAHGRPGRVEVGWACPTWRPAGPAGAGSACPTVTTVVWKPTERARLREPREHPPLRLGRHVAPRVRGATRQAVREPEAEPPRAAPRHRTQARRRAWPGEAAVRCHWRSPGPCGTELGQQAAVRSRRARPPGDRQVQTMAQGPQPGAAQVSPRPPRPPRASPRPAPASQGPSCPEPSSLAPSSLAPSWPLSSWPLSSW